MESSNSAILPVSSATTEVLSYFAPRATVTKVPALLDFTIIVLSAFNFCSAALFLLLSSARLLPAGASYEATCLALLLACPGLLLASASVVSLRRRPLPWRLAVLALRLTVGTSFILLGFTKAEPLIQLWTYAHEGYGFGVLYVLLVGMYFKGPVLVTILCGTMEYLLMTRSDVQRAYGEMAEAVSSERCWRRSPLFILIVYSAIGLGIGWGLAS